jgi:hypothetical protein
VLQYFESTCVRANEQLELLVKLFGDFAKERRD